MSSACNVIATKNVGVHSSLITHTENGYLVDAGDVFELKRLLLATVKKEIPYIGKEARTEVIKNWSAEKEAQNLIKVYQS